MQFIKFTLLKGPAKYRAGSLLVFHDSDFFNGLSDLSVRWPLVLKVSIEYLIPEELAQYRPLKVFPVTFSVHAFPSLGNDYFSLREVMEKKEIFRTPLLKVPKSLFTSKKRSIPCFSYVSCSIVIHFLSASSVPFLFFKTVQVSTHSTQANSKLLFLRFC